MLDELNKDSLDGKSWDSKNLDDNLDRLNLDDFSSELNELEDGIKWAMEKQAEDDILKQTADGLKEIKSDINPDLNLDPEWESFTEKEKKNVSEFFKQWRKEFQKIDNVDEKKVVSKYKKFKTKKSNISGRPLGVQEAIMESVDLIVDEVNSRNKEKNPIARSLLKIVDLIMKTEK